MPPWKQPVEWAAIHKTLAQTILDKRKQLAKPLCMAKEICRQLEITAQQMDSLGLRTCCSCEDVCCRKARIWADFRDLLFLHMTGQALPLVQTISHLNQVCRYLDSRGCTLPRLSRPFVCTWYLCPAQVSLLQTEPENDGWKGLRDTLQSIKNSRINMENAFVAALS